MVKYELEVTTANFSQACTTNNVFVKLVGIDGESKRTWLKSIKGVAAFFMGMVSLHYYRQAFLLRKLPVPNEKVIA